MTIVLIRSLILYGTVIFSVRLMGKRQLGELQPAELVITILVSNIATLALEDTEIPLLHGILPILALVCYEVIVSWISLKSERVRRWVSGVPKTVIRNGQIDQDMLHELRFSVDDLMTALRMNGVFYPEQVQYAVVETNGGVSVYQKSAVQPAEKQDVQAVQPDTDPPHVIIADGQLRPEALASIGKDQRWLLQLLTEKRTTLPEVFLLTADRAGSFHIVMKKEAGT